jgi:cyclohexanecarboxylate-CoA ligase
MDVDGYIRITGRSKDIIIRGGENIPVVEIEELIYRLPAVQSAAIVAMPDARLGERACVYVVLQPGTTLTFDEVVAHLVRNNVARNYFPERLEIVPEMPRTASGKIQKYVLRERARALGAERK